MATVSTTIKLDKDLKNEAQRFFDEYGLSLSAAMNMFLRQVVKEQAIPFRIGEVRDTRKQLTYEEVIAALEEASAEAQKPGYKESLIGEEEFMREMWGIVNGDQI